MDATLSRLHNITHRTVSANKTWGSSTLPEGLRTKLRIAKIEISEARGVEIAYPPLHEGVEEEGRAAGGLGLHRVEAAEHIDVDLLHPLREGLELHKRTRSASAPEESVREIDSG